MASTVEQAALIESLIEAEADRIDDLFERHREMVYTRIIRLLNDPQFRLETYPNGQIKPTAANLRKINQIIARASHKLLPQYMISGIEDMEKAYIEIEKANNSYFQSLGVKFKHKPVYKAMTKAAIDQTLYLLDPKAMAQSLQEPIRQVLTTYITTGGDFPYLVDTLRKGILNQPAPNRESTRQDEAALKKGFNPYHRLKLVVHDATFQYSRNYTRLVADDYGFEFYRYSGGTVKDSRPFCKHHTKHVYHVEEIRDLPEKPALPGFRYDKKGNWLGKREGTNSTNIFTYIGGWGCRHHLIPVHWKSVPRVDVERIRKKGLWKHD